MKTIQTVRTLALCAGAIFCAGAAAAGYISTQKAVEPGVWTSDYDGAMEYTEKNNVPMFLFWANAGCGHCEGIEKEMNKDPFLTWMADQQMVMVFIESNSTVKKWIKSHARTKIKDFPYVAVYWPRNTAGEEVLEGFSAYKGNMSLYGANSKDSNIKQIMDTVAYLLPDWDPDGGGSTTDPVYYTVTFVVDETKGAVTSGSLSQSVESGKSAAAPTVQAKDGWEFTGWDKSFSKVTGDLTVTAKFSAEEEEPDPVYYTVTFVVDETKGTVTSGSLSQSVESGKSATAPTVAAKDGWEFDGWDRSFGKVTGDLTVTAEFEEIVEREEVDPAKLFKKAQTVEAVAYKDGELFGKATVKLGKYNTRKEYVKASFKISAFGGKSYSKSLNVEPDEYGDILEVAVKFSSPVGEMEFSIVNGEDGFTVVGENDEYYVENGEVEIGGSLENDEVALSVELDDIEPENDNYYFIVDAPSYATATVKNGKTLNFGSAPKIKYQKFKEDGETWYELAEYDEERYPNVNAVKVTYKPTTGVFSGSFKMYASNEFAIDDGKKPTIKTYTGKVSGYVVNGSGVGTVSVKVGRKTYTGTCTLD